MAMTARADDRARRLTSPVDGVLLWALRVEPRDGDDRAEFLEPDDAARLAALRTEDADALRARRALVRTTVGALANCPPEAVRVTTGNGPRRVLVPGGSGWYVSSASSGTSGLLTLAAVPVGVDVERLPGPVDALQVSTHLLPLPEHTWISAGGSDLPRRFLETWVRKEAVVKCTGEGLQRDLRSFLVDASAPSAEVTAPDGTTLGMHTHAVGYPGHIAALALADAAPASACAAGAARLGT